MVLGDFGMKIDLAQILYVYTNSYRMVLESGP